MEKELLIKLVQESNSLSEILRKLNKSVSGKAIELLKLKLDLYEINYLFKTNNISKKIPLKDILIENKNYSSNRLKLRLIKEGLKLDVCEICGQLPIWNNKPLTLLLDHINGNHLDNRILNLRIVCPNCHTQTETFGNKKNDDNRNYCPDCGTEIGKNSKYCRKCGPKHRTYSTLKVSKENIPTKDELLELIQTYSFVSIGKMYNVSDNLIRKWCKKYKIPSTKKELRGTELEGSI